MGPGSGMGAGFVGGWWLPLLLAFLVLGAAAVALYLTTRDEGGEDGALAVLRERYAAGELDEEEFERRRERLAGEIG